MAFSSIANCGKVACMTGSIAAPRLAALSGDFDRDLALALGLSLTTVSRAYAALVEAGFAVARQGSGTYTRLPGGRRQAFDRSLTPHTGSEDLIDLSCAAY